MERGAVEISAAGWRAGRTPGAAPRSRRARSFRRRRILVRLCKMGLALNWPLVVLGAGIFAVLLMSSLTAWHGPV